jgi:hypothetical protein
VWPRDVLQIQVWIVQVVAKDGSIQGVQIGISDYQYSARRQGIRHLYAQLDGPEVNTGAAKTCLDYLVNIVLTDSLIIEPPTKDRCTSASHMIHMNVVEAVPYKSLAECYLLEKVVDLVPPTIVQDASEGRWSMTPSVSEVEIPTVVVESPTSGTETEAVPVQLAAGSANQSGTGQHWQDPLAVQPWALLLGHTPEEFAFHESEARFGTATQACLTSASVFGSKFVAAHRLREFSTELEVQAKSQVIKIRKMWVSHWSHGEPC